MVIRTPSGSAVRVMPRIDAGGRRVALDRVRRASSRRAFGSVVSLASAARRTCRGRDRRRRRAAAGGDGRRWRPLEGARRRRRSRGTQRARRVARLRSCASSRAPVCAIGVVAEALAGEARPVRPPATGRCRCSRSSGSCGRRARRRRRRCASAAASACCRASRTRALAAPARGCRDRAPAAPAPTPPAPQRDDQRARSLSEIVMFHTDRLSSCASTSSK